MSTIPLEGGEWGRVWEVGGGSGSPRAYPSKALFCSCVDSTFSCSSALYNCEPALYLWVCASGFDQVYNSCECVIVPQVSTRYTMLWMCDWSRGAWRLGVSSIAGRRLVLVTAWTQWTQRRAQGDFFICLPGLRTQHWAWTPARREEHGHSGISQQSVARTRSAVDLPGRDHSQQPASFPLYPVTNLPHFFCIQSPACFISSVSSHQPASFPLYPVTTFLLGAIVLLHSEVTLCGWQDVKIH